METKFTPGPWKVKVYNGVPVVLTDDAVGTFIASVCNPMNEFAGGNADILSAAPELLDALELASAVLSGEEMTKSTLIRALEKSRDALRKAKGGGSERV